ncbi:hypothetical protein [Aestuariivirga sp.]|jgi:hypothetical protein|uniref:hypothetical protein n=1 Tax=Aestuariivirga sp. TaxID=2650926 RepID=UPI003783AB37
MTIRLTAVLLAVSAGLLSAGPSLADRSAADQALYKKAMKDCNGPSYPCGARPLINYSGGWYRCVEPRSCR